MLILWKVFHAVLCSVFKIFLHMNRWITWWVGSSYAVLFHSLSYYPSSFYCWCCQWLKVVDTHTYMHMHKHILSFGACTFSALWAPCVGLQCLHPALRGKKSHSTVIAQCEWYLHTPLVVELTGPAPLFVVLGISRADLAESYSVHVDTRDLSSGLYTCKSGALCHCSFLPDQCFLFSVKV